MKKLVVSLIIIALTMGVVFATGAVETKAPVNAPAKEIGSKPDNYPTKTIEFIVPAAAGAAIDVPARALLEVLDLGKPVVIVNRAGASQTVGTAEAAIKKPDGYTMVLGANGNFMIQPHLLDLTYKTTDFRHISMLTAPIEMVIVVTPSSRFKTFKDLEAALKSGTALSYSTANPGSVGHLAGISMFQQMGANPKNIPFNGSPEGIAALLGGHIDFYIIDSSEVVPRVQNGQFAPLVTMSEERALMLPDVPALKEYGYKDLIFMGFKWIAVHKDTPDDIVQYLKRQIDTAIQSEQYQAFLKKITGVGVRVYTEAEITDVVMKNLDESGKLLEALGMKKK